MRARNIKLVTTTMSILAGVAVITNANDTIYAQDNMTEANTVSQVKEVTEPTTQELKQDDNDTKVTESQKQDDESDKAKETDVYDDESTEDESTHSDELEISDEVKPEIQVYATRSVTNPYEPKEGTPAYMPGMWLDDEVFDNVQDALKYANNVFDWKTDNQFYVRYNNGKYIVYWNLKANNKPTTQSKPAPQVHPEVPKVNYTVVSGDYLYKIANKYGVSVDALKKANKLSSNMIHPGDKLVIPAAKSETPAPKPSKPTPKPSPQTSYTVVSGDYLYKIANKYGVSVDALKKANKLSSNMIHPGDKLVIPGAKSETPAPKPSKPTPKPSPQTSYTVVSGDYLYKIANKYGISVDALKKANKLSSNMIHPGDKLVIPGAKSETPAPKPSKPTPKPSPQTSYTVVSGDYLYKIANKYGVSVDALKKANKLSSNMIHPGDKLVIPGAKSEIPALKPSKPTPKPSPQTSYTVVSGDYLYKIANKYGISVDALKKANKLSSNMIHPGDKLVIPGAKSETPNKSVEKPAPVVKNGRELDSHTFADIPSALAYGRKEFDDTKHNEFYVEYEKGHYVVYWEMKKPTAQTKVSNSNYTVKAGDSLWALAKKYNITVDKIKKDSGITSGFLHIGDKLVIK